MPRRYDNTVIIHQEIKYFMCVNSCMLNTKTDIHSFDKLDMT